MSVYALGEAFQQRRMAQVRDLFPTLKREVHEHPLTYLDTAATAQKPVSVIQAEADFYRNHNANAHRGLHTLAAEATEAYEEGRERVAEFIGAPGAASVVFTRNATHSLNLVARGWEHMLRPGDEILLTEMEHHANLVPWIMLAKRKRLVLRHIPIDDRGQLDMEAARVLLSKRARVLSLAHVSNVLGTVNPVEELAEMARELGALVVVDAAQSVGHMPVDFAGLGADLLVFSAHKAYGPAGLGFLVGRPDVLEVLEPMEGGGEMIDEVTLGGATWAEVPHRFEPGTGNVAAVVAFDQAIAMLRGLGTAWIREHERQLVGYGLERLSAIPGIDILGPLEADRRGGLISFVDERVHPHDLATLADFRGVAIRAGHHCAMPLHTRLGIPASARASFGLYSDARDVDALVEAIEYARSYFS